MRYPNKKSQLVICLMLVIALLLTACGGIVVPQAAEVEVAPQAEVEDTGQVEAETEAAPAAAAASVLVFATEGSPPTFDPLAATDSRVDTPSLNLYNALVQIIPGTSDIEMELAESVEAAEDGLSYTINLRKGVKFHDGSELTAEDVKYTVDRMLALQTGVYRGLTPVVGAEVIDDYTVVLKLDSTFPGLLQALTRLYILNSELVQANEADGDWGQTWLQNHDAGSGPYQLVSFQPEQQFTVEKFPDYFKGWEGSHVDRVIWRVIKEEATRRLALETGDADWIHIGSAEVYAALEEQADAGIVVSSDRTLNQLYFAFNNENEYLQDPRIRKALALAYDYQGHVELARNGHGSVARGGIPEAIPCFDDSISPSETDLEQAKALMAEAGYPDGGFELVMAYQGTGAEEVAAFQIFQAAAAELGVTISSMPVEWPAKVAAFSSQETAPDIGTIWIFPSFADPDQYFFRLGHSSQAGSEGLNFAYYSNPRMDELLDAGKSELDPDKRCEIYREVQQIWVEDMPYANVSIMHSLSAWRDYVQGYVWTSAHSLTQNAYYMSVDGKPTN